MATPRFFYPNNSVKTRKKPTRLCTTKQFNKLRPYDFARDENGIYNGLPYTNELTPDELGTLPLQFKLKKDIGSSIASAKRLKTLWLQNLYNAIEIESLHRNPYSQVTITDQKKYNEALNQLYLDSHPHIPKSNPTSILPSSNEEHTQNSVCTLEQFNILRPKYRPICEDGVCQKLPYTQELTFEGLNLSFRLREDIGMFLSGSLQPKWLEELCATIKLEKQPGKNYYIVEILDSQQYDSVLQDLCFRIHAKKIPPDQKLRAINLSNVDFRNTTSSIPTVSSSQAPFKANPYSWRFWENPVMNNNADKNSLNDERKPNFNP